MAVFARCIEAKRLIAKLEYFCMRVTAPSQPLNTLRAVGIDSEAIQ